MELIDFQNDFSLKSLTSSSENIWPFVPKEKYPILVQVGLRVKAMFSSTYPVSYTHLDVYKRQQYNFSISCMEIPNKVPCVPTSV